MPTTDRIPDVMHNESPEQTIARLRLQNKQAADERDKAFGKLEKRYAYYANLFSDALRWATRTENDGKCPICHQPSKHGKIAQHSQYCAALVSLDRVIDVVDVAESILATIPPSHPETEYAVLYNRLKETVERLHLTESPLEWRSDSKAGEIAKGEVR